MSITRAFIAVGFHESEAKVVSYIIDHENCTIEELIENTGLSRGTVYKCLKNLINNNYVIKSDKIPFKYSVTPHLLSTFKAQFDGFYRKISLQIKPRKIVESQVILKRICNIFEKNGYAIREPPKATRDVIGSTILPRFRSQFFLDKIADGEYSIGISIIDKRKQLNYPREIVHHGLFSDLSFLSRELNCITSFVFIHTDRKDHETLSKKLKQVQLHRPLFPARLLERTENFGIDKRGMFVFTTDEDLQERISSALQEIHQRRIIVSSMSQNLKDKMRQMQELVMLSQEHARRIDTLFLTKAPFDDKRIAKYFDEINDPVQRIKNREIRNLGIFRRKFSEDEVRINQSLDAVERRIYLPDVGTLERHLNELDSIMEKFKSIEYELDDLRSALFKYGVDLIESLRTKRTALINPFIFTEPYEKKPFFVNEEKLKNAARALSKAILENLPGYFQIVTGNAGMGKTHAARYIHGSIVENENIKSLYIDCPLNYDLVSGIFQELTQESLFPAKLAGTVRELRKNVPSTTRDLLRVIGEITEIWKKQGYKGLLLVLDEIENAIPYTFFEEEKSKAYQPPLALRQIKEMLSQHMIPNLGFLLCCRSKIYPLLKDVLKIENIEKFSYEPESLGTEDFIELIQHRYEMWAVEKAPVFKEETIGDVTKITKGNTRDSIIYLRELFEFATRNKLEKIDRDSIRKIGSIPLFRY